MPRIPSRRVSDCVQTEDEEYEPDEDPLALHNSDSSQETSDDNEDQPVSVKETLPSRPTRAAKVKCLQQLSKVNVKQKYRSSVPEERQHQQRYVSKLKASESSELCEPLLKELKNDSKLTTGDIKEHKCDFKEQSQNKVNGSNRTVESVKEYTENQMQYTLKCTINQTVEKHVQLLEQTRLCTFQDRPNYGIEEYSKFLEKRQTSMGKKRKDTETEEQRQQRLVKERTYVSKHRPIQRKLRTYEHLEEKRQQCREICEENRLENIFDEIANQYQKNMEMRQTLPICNAEESIEQYKIKKNIEQKKSIVDGDKHIEDGPSQVSLSSHSSNTQERHNGNQNIQLYTLEFLLSRPQRPPQVSYLQEILKPCSNNPSDISIKDDINQVDLSKRIMNEITKDREQRKEKQRLHRANESFEQRKREYNTTKSKGGVNQCQSTDDIIDLDSDEEVKTEPSNHEYDQYKASETKDDLKHSVYTNDNIHNKLESRDGFSNNYIKTEDNALLDDKYEVKLEPKLEIDTESKDTQRITSNDGKIAMTDDIVNAITKDVMKQLKGDITDANNINTTVGNKETNISVKLEPLERDTTVLMQPI